MGWNPQVVVFHNSDVTHLYVCERHLMVISEGGELFSFLNGM